jgi:predicted PurR-regulated permease PerM
MCNSAPVRFDRSIAARAARSASLDPSVASAVIIGGGLGGIPGVIVAVPTLAVLRVLFDFFRVRLKTDG